MCLNYKCESGCRYGEKCRYSHTLRLMGSPVKKVEEKWCEGSVALLNESTQLGCVSQDSHTSKSFPRNARKWGSNHTVKFSKGTWQDIKIRDRKGSSRGIIQKCEPLERNPRAPRFEERTHDETLQQERYARRAAWDSVKSVYKLKKFG